jgi:hypothetical protein
MKTSLLLLVVLLVPTCVVAAENPWSGFYDAATLTAWSSRVIPGIEQTLREDLLPRVPPESRQALRGVALRFPLEDAQVPFGFKSRWDANAIVLPASSMRLFRDLCVAYAWLSRNGYTTDTVSDYLTMLRSQWPSETLRRGKHTPLETLGVPADAMNDSRVELIATATFSSGMTFIMGHELGHIAYRHPAYNAVSRAEARANEVGADEFALELMKQLGVAPIGVLIFFTAVAHWELDGMATVGARDERTHPLNADRINHVGQWMLSNADAFSRSAANPARARAEIDRIAPQFFKISEALASEGANVLLRLRGLTVTADGLSPRRVGDPLIPLRADSGKPSRRWDGVFIGEWISAGGIANPAAMQLSPAAEGVRGFYVFGAGRVRLEGEADGNELHYRWSLDDANRGTGVLRVSADGRQLTGTWKRENDGYVASWKLKWKGYPVIPGAAARHGRAERATPERSLAGGRGGELGVAAADDPRPRLVVDRATGADVRWTFTVMDQAHSDRDPVDAVTRPEDIIMGPRAGQSVAEGGPGTDDTAAGRSAVLIGHWRTTRIVFDSARDDHLVLRADGSAETWSVTASSRGSRVSGRWSSSGSTLNVIWDNGNQLSQPFTMYQRQLVLPNIQGKRRFWDRLE